MADELFALIMAGGGGTRLWPLSRNSQPKQALRLNLGERTMFQRSVERLAPLIEPGRILVATIEPLIALLQSQVPALAAENFLYEPARRGTASIIGLAALILETRHPGACMACLTADHEIRNEPRFRQVLAAAQDLARDGYLVTLGIEPGYPATGYGYIEQEARLNYDGPFAAFRVRSFKEKPALEVAQAYCAAGSYYWNSGMFIWRAGRILEEIERWMPELHAGLQAIKPTLESAGEQAMIRTTWESLPSQTIDYGIMEKAERVAMLRADQLGWLDIGSWDRFFEALRPDAAGNLLLGSPILALETENTLVYRDPARHGDKLVAVLGLQDMIIVDTEDVLLVCPRGQAEEVRRLVAEIKKQNLGQYL